MTTAVPPPVAASSTTPAAAATVTSTASPSSSGQQQQQPFRPPPYMDAPMAPPPSTTDVPPPSFSIPPHPMERVLFNLHRQVCTFVLRHSSPRVRNWIERALLFVAVCGFGALLLAHVHFVHKAPSTTTSHGSSAATASHTTATAPQSSSSSSSSSWLDSPRHCFWHIPGFQPHAHVTHVYIVYDETPPAEGDNMHHHSDNNQQPQHTTTEPAEGPRRRKPGHSWAYTTTTTTTTTSAASTKPTTPLSQQPCPPCATSSQDTMASSSSSSSSLPITNTSHPVVQQTCSAAVSSKDSRSHDCPGDDGENLHQPPNNNNNNHTPPSEKDPLILPTCTTTTSLSNDSTTQDTSSSSSSSYSSTKGSSSPPPPPAILSYQLSYSRIQGYLWLAALSSDHAPMEGFSVQHVLVSQHDAHCFGEPFLQRLIFQWMGPETVIWNWCLAFHDALTRREPFSSTTGSRPPWLLVDRDNDPHNHEYWSSPGYVYNPHTQAIVELRPFATHNQHPSTTGNGASNGRRNHLVLSPQPPTTTPYSYDHGPMDDTQQYPPLEQRPSPSNKHGESAAYSSTSHKRTSSSSSPRQPPEYVYTSTTATSSSSYVQAMAFLAGSKLSMVLKTCFLYFITTTLVSFTLRETQERMLDFTQHLQAHVRNRRSVVSLVTRHLVDNLVFVPIMVGMIFFLIEFYGGDKLLAFGILTLVWFVEVFNVIAVRTYSSLQFFPKIVFLLFALWHFYIFSFPYGFSYTALAATVCFMLHSMVFFWHRFELPAIVMGQVTLQTPRMYYQPYPQQPQQYYGPYSDYPSTMPAAQAPHNPMMQNHNNNNNPFPPPLYGGGGSTQGHRPPYQSPLPPDAFYHASYTQPPFVEGTATDTRGPSPQPSIRYHHSNNNNNNNIPIHRQSPIMLQHSHHQHNVSPLQSPLMGHAQQHGQQPGSFATPPATAAAATTASTNASQQQPLASSVPATGLHALQRRDSVSPPLLLVHRSTRRSHSRSNLHRSTSQGTAFSWSGANNNNNNATTTSTSNPPLVPGGTTTLATGSNHSHHHPHHHSSNNPTTLSRPTSSISFNPHASFSAGGSVGMTGLELAEDDSSSYLYFMGGEIVLHQPSSSRRPSF